MTVVLVVYVVAFTAAAVYCYKRIFAQLWWFWLLVDVVASNAPAAENRLLWSCRFWLLILQCSSLLLLPLLLLVP